MNEVVKIDLKISRKTVLLLSSVLERGLDKEGGTGLGLIGVVPVDIADELRSFASDCLHKAGLAELNEKIKHLEAK